MLSARCKGEGKFWVRCNVSYLTACVRACTTMMAARIYAAAWSERGEKVKLDETKLATFPRLPATIAHVSHAANGEEKQLKSDYRHSIGFQ